MGVCQKSECESISAAFPRHYGGAMGVWRDCAGAEMMSGLRGAPEGV